MAEEPKLSEELKKMEAEYEPLLPIEKKLIVWSLGLGIILLVVLVWVSYTFFPASHG
jgi:polyferredoxin